MIDIWKPIKGPSFGRTLVKSPEWVLRRVLAVGNLSVVYKRYYVLATSV